MKSVEPDSARCNPANRRGKKLDPKRNPERRPPTLPVNPRGVPRSLRRARRWMLWRWAWSYEKWTKRPYQSSGSLAASDDPKTWTNFESALAGLYDGTGRFHAIGFALGDGWIGIDVDRCRSVRRGTLDRRALRIVRLARSYAEASPSRTGIKIVARGKLPKGRNKRRDKTVELYERQYFTITGQRIPRTPREPQRRTRAFVRIQREFIGTEPEPAGSKGGQPTRPWIARPPGKPSPRLSDTDVLAIAGGAKNGEKFKRLWRGDFAGLYGSHSEADFGLLAMLRFYTQDGEQLDRLFRQSKLYRATGKSRTYIATMIRKAIEGGGETFQPTSMKGVSWAAQHAAFAALLKRLKAEGR